MSTTYYTPITTQHQRLHVYPQPSLSYIFHLYTSSSSYPPLRYKVIIITIHQTLIKIQPTKKAFQFTRIMPRLINKQHHRTVPHPMDTELHHPFFHTTFAAIKSFLDYASQSMILPIVICAVAIGLFLSFGIPFLLVASMWIEQGLYTFFDVIAAVYGGYLLGV